LFRPAGAPSFRFFRAVGDVLPGGVNGPTVFLNNLSFTGGNTFDVGTANLVQVLQGSGGFPELDGGAARFDSATLIGNNLSFFNNTSGEDGGALSINAWGKFYVNMQIDNATFAGNFAGDRGGAIHGVQNGTLYSADGLTVRNSSLTGNIALDGGGAVDGRIFRLAFENSKINSNRGATGGVYASQISAVNTLFRGNIGTASGGGNNAAAVIADGNMLSLVNSTVTENSSANSGAVVGQGSGYAVEVINSTIHNNTGGAAALVATTGQAFVAFSTITNNRSSNGDVAGLAADKNIVTIYGTVVAGNRVTDPLSPNADLKVEQVRNDGGNLIGVAPTSYPRLPGDLYGIAGQELNPLLSKLDFYTNPNIPVRLPTAGSPLLNAAVNPLATRLFFDARGLPRPDFTNLTKRADIGAAELQPGDPLLAAEPALPPLNVPPPPPPPPPPAIFTAVIDPAVDNAGAVAEIRGFFQVADTNAFPDDTINLFPGGKYVFDNASATGFGSYDGGTALHVFVDPTGKESLTVNGNGATLFRPAGAPSFRFFRAVGDVSGSIGPTVFLNNLSFTGGNTFDVSTPNLFLSSKGSSGLPELDGGAARFDSATLIGNNLTFTNNTTGEDGGALSINAAGGFRVNSQIDNSLFASNYAGDRGGAINVFQSGTANSIDGLTVRNSSLTGNIALDGAGAIDGRSIRIVLKDSKINSNRGATGGVYASQISAVNTLFRGNVGTASGGGNNAAAVIADSNMLSLVNSTVTENASTLDGAVVGRASGYAVEIINSTIHNNSGGEAALVATTGEVVIAFSTITNNRNSLGSIAGVSSAKNIVTTFGSVIAGNRVSNPLSPTVDIGAGQIRNDGGNLIGVAPTYYPRQLGDLAGNPGEELNPLLSRMDVYGGGFIPVRLPTAGSPLLNAAVNPLATRLFFDARGLPRPDYSNLSKRADIGAVELQPGDPSLAAEPALPPLSSLGLPTVIAVGPGPMPTMVSDPNQPPVSKRGSVDPNNNLSGVPALPPNQAKLYDGAGKLVMNVTPFSSQVPGGVRVVAADLNGDGSPELIAGTGPGVPTQVVIFDGKTQNKIATFAPFEASFTGGIFLAAGDLTGDFKADLVITPDQGGGPRVRVFTGTNFTPLADFFGIEDPNFRGGARAAVGDMTGDGLGELVVAAGTGGGPRVAIWDGSSRVGNAYTVKPIPDFFLFEQSLRNGLYPALGDVNADGKADLITGAGPNGGPRLMILNGFDLLSKQDQIIVPIANFFVGSTDRRDGIPVAAVDIDGDGMVDVVTGGGRVGSVSGFLGKNLSSVPLVESDFSFTPFTDFAGGVFVG
jgi:predicted outer membrane repeat protein